MEPQTTDVVAPEPNFAEMSDAELDSITGTVGDDGLPAPEKVEPSPPDESKDAAPASGEEPSAEEPKQPDINELQERIDKIEAEREALSKRLQDREATIGNQGQELGELRKVKAAILDRMKQRDGIDRHQQMIDDPVAFQNMPIEQMQDKQALENIERQEKEIQRVTAINEQLNKHSEFLNQHAPDLTEHVEEVANFFLENGASPDAIAQFKANPAAEHPGMVWSTLQLVKANKTIENLQAELEKAKAAPGSILNRIEQESRKPLTNSAGAGGQTGGAKGDLTPEAISGLSDDDLDALLKEL